MSSKIKDGEGNLQTLKNADDLDATLRELIGEDTASPNAYTMMARLTAIAVAIGALDAGDAGLTGQNSLVAGIGAPGDAAWTGTGNAGLVSLFKLIALKMLDESAAKVALGTLTDIETAAAINAQVAALGKPGDAATVNSLIGLMKLLISYSDGQETSLVQIGGYLDAVEGLITATNQALAKVGTRGYGTPLGRYAYTTTSSALSEAIVATEVTLHNCGTGRCFFRLGVNPTIATLNDIPLEPGEKLTLQVTSGHKLTAIGETGAGNINIIPVA